MKKLLMVLAAAFVFSAAAFCEEGFNLDMGVGTSISGALKPYADVDVNVNYEFANGIALGIGCKENFNFTPGRTVSKDDEKGESLLYTQPYLLFKAKYFTMAGGMCISNDTNPVYQNFYVHLGSDIPIWQMGNGKLGFDAGLEGWLSLCAIESEGETTSQDIGAALGTIFTTIFNSVKLNFGVKYYLPL